jgi:hypothetical protein
MGRDGTELIGMEWLSTVTMVVHCLELSGDSENLVEKAMSQWAICFNLNKIMLTISILYWFLSRPHHITFHISPCVSPPIITSHSTFPRVWPKITCHGIGHSGAIVFTACGLLWTHAHTRNRTRNLVWWTTLGQLHSRCRSRILMWSKWLLDTNGDRRWLILIKGVCTEKARLRMPPFQTLHRHKPYFNVVVCHKMTPWYQWGQTLAYFNKRWHSESRSAHASIPDVTSAQAVF